jgi:hypothetical protein
MIETPTSGAEDFHVQREPLSGETLEFMHEYTEVAQRSANEFMKIMEGSTDPQQLDRHLAAEATRNQWLVDHPNIPYTDKDKAAQDLLKYQEVLNGSYYPHSAV